MSAFIKTASSYVQGARTLGREYYTSAGIFAREMDRIFPSRWLCVGREDQIAAARRVLRAGRGIREHDHPARPRRSDARVLQRLPPPRHANVRGRRGTIFGDHPVSVPRLDVRDRRPARSAHRTCTRSRASTSGLPAPPGGVGQWEGFLFVNLSRRSAAAAKSRLRRCRGGSTRFKLATLARVRRIEYEVRANWKLIFQNYNECLHCPTIHPSCHDAAVHERRERPGRGAVPRRLHGDHGTARERHHDRAGVRRAAGRIWPAKICGARTTTRCSPT